MRTVGIIPARYGSERLPGKPLLDIGGKPMLWRVYQRVRDVPGLDAVFAATDDQRIFRVCQELGIPARMTDPGHRTAAGRLWEASEMIPADFYIQINGDEPLINPRAVEAAIPKEAPLGREFGTNVITPITDPAQVMDASNIKVVWESLDTIKKCWIFTTNRNRDSWSGRKESIRCVFLIMEKNCV